MDITINKRDGNREPFSYDKLVASIAGSGVPITESERLAAGVKQWIEQKAGTTGVINSIEIRDYIIEKMMEEFPVEADHYKAFKKD